MNKEPPTSFLFSSFLVLLSSFLSPLLPTLYMLGTSLELSYTFIVYIQALACSKIMDYFVYWMLIMLQVNAASYWINCF